jgi:HEAT repeat protein
MLQRTVGGPSFLWLGILALLGGGVCRAAEADPDLPYAEKTLQDARIGTDGPSLLKFFRDRTLSPADRARLADQVRALGSEDFQTRRKAYQDLQAAGRNARPFLREGVKSPDPEVARSSERLLKQIESGADTALTTAAARVLAARKPEGAAAVLLAYLPLAQDEVIEEALVSALAAVALKDGKVDPAVLTAATDREAVRRLAAAVVLSKAGADQRPAVRRLLKDADSRVRFQAALSLVRGGEKSAVDVLIALLGDPSMELVWQAEDMLCRIAGEKSPPSVDLHDAAARRKYRQAWEDWWKANAAGVDLAKLDLQKADRGLMVISEYDGGKDGQGKVWECGMDGKPRWELDSGMGGPLDARHLPNNRVLVAEYTGHRVTERDRQGKIHWEYKAKTSVLSCERLANGNTLIASLNEVLEVTREGKVVYSYPQGTTYYATKLPNRHILLTNATHIVELDTAGKQVRSIPVTGIGWGTVERLPNGRYLAALYGGGKAVEVDATGKILWQCNVASATQAIRLRNGNTLVSSAEGRMVAEFDRTGKEVWRKATAGRAWRVRRH